MRFSARWRAAAVLAAVASLAVAGCGGSSNDSSSGGGNQPTAPPQGAKKGGDLTVLYNADVDNIDPGITYYQYGFNVAYATQRPLYSYKPDDATNPQPDLAEGAPQISPDGKTVTVKIRAGVKFSPPVNREVTSKDVRYGLERGFLKTVNGAYVGAYMGDVDGLKAYQDGKAKNISGLQTPDDHTLVIKLVRPRGAIVAGMLSMPASAPVPEDYAAKFDKQQPSSYGQHQVSTGPYMIQNDSSGKLTGYKPGDHIDLVRNPNWDASTDYKPAYLNSITIKEGVDPDVGARQVVSGSHLVSGDFQLTPATLQRVSRTAKDLLLLTPPTGRYRYIALNTTAKPFDNVNVRRAVIAGFDRTALRQAFGGPIVGDIPTHYIPPGQPGFDQAGGAKGPGYDFMSHPSGDMALAASYMKKAGYPSGKYTGNETLTMVSDNATQQLNVSEIAAQQFEKMGFKVKLKGVTRDSMYTKFCQVPKAEPPICPSVGWLKDFADPEAELGPVFNGKNILQVGNSNFAQLNDKSLNDMMDKAEVINQPTKRIAAWGAVDKKITDLAPGVPWLWDKQPVLHSKDVNGVINVSNASWDLTSTSIK
ncbi:MAG TPA: ABC transporter substrate-binding protein [Solirubrobacteraceae bacterium]|nr:ABC transporter substrate-binding protein [Solirubrobacteraceae bacterium]